MREGRQTVGTKTLRRALTSSVALLLLCAGSARADEPAEPFGGDGWYMGLQGVYAFEEFDTGGTPLDVNDEFGLNGHAGYRFLQNFSVDVEIEYINGFEVEVPGGGGQLQTWNVAFNFRVYPIARLVDQSSFWGRFQPFLQGAPAWQWARLTGLGDMNTEDGTFLGRAGGGLEIYLTRHLALTGNAIYNFTTGELDGLDYLSVGWGLQYHFGVSEY